MPEYSATDIGNVAIFGIGSMGQRYRRLLRDNIGVPDKDVFLCDTVNGDTGRQWFDGPEQLCERLDRESVGLAIVSTPADSHIEYLCHVAETFPNAAVLVEKPLTNGRISDCDPMLVPSLFTRTIAVGYNWRFHPWVKILKSTDSPIVDLSLHVSEDMRNWPGKSYGMPLYEFSHELDMVRVLLDKPVVTSVNHASRGEHYRINGEHERGEWKVVIRSADCPKSRWFRATLRNGMQMSGKWPTSVRTIERTYLKQLENLIAASQGGDGPRGIECPLHEGYATAKFVDRIASAL